MENEAASSLYAEKGTVKAYHIATESTSSQEQPTTTNEKQEGSETDKDSTVKHRVAFDIASHVTSSWEPTSNAARQLLSDVMQQAASCCLKDPASEVAKPLLDHVISRVIQQLPAVKAPEDNRLRSYHDARERMLTVGKELTETMEKAQTIKCSLKKQRRFMANLQGEIEALEVCLSDGTSNFPNFPITTTKIGNIDKETFVDSMMSLFTQVDDKNTQDNEQTQTVN